MRLTDLDYVLPETLIAQEPAAEREHARLLALGDAARPHRHLRVADLPGLLRAGDVLVLNDTRVIPARTYARRPSGGRLEVLFVRPAGDDPREWETLVRGTPRPGERVHFADVHGEWTASLGDGRWRLRMALAEPVAAWLERTGEVPLPPYVRRSGGPTPADRERYQTTYARHPGAVAAPTAGLHLTPSLLEALRAAGVDVVTLTLHVGPGTFMPIRGDDLETYAMPSEAYDLPATTAERITAARADGRRIVAVGTTTVRALESAAVDGPLSAGAGEAALFIRPGHRFRVVDAFVGARWRDLYAEALDAGYRFLSFGDAMWLARRAPVGPGEQP